MSGSTGVHRPAQLSEQAASHLRALIISGELRQGARIRAEHVAERLEISPTPVREALQALRAEGFVDLVPRHGYRVAPLSEDDVRDLYRVQALLAGEMAARAAVSIDQQGLDEMLEIHEQLTAAAERGDSEALEHLNHRFHRHINLTGGSRKLLWAIGLMARYVPREFYGAIPDWPETTSHDHQNLVDAISARDADRARAEMEAHITHAGELLAKYLGQRRSRDEETE